MDINNNIAVTMPISQLQAERIRFLYSQANISLIGHILCSLGVAYVFLNYVDLTSIALWLLSMLLVVSIRFTSVYYFNKKAHEDDVILKWGWFFTLMVFLTGCVWGSASYIFILYSHPYLTLFMVMVITGMLVASLASLSVFMWAYYAFAIPTGVPFIYQLSSGGSDEYLIYSLLITAFIIVQMAYARVNQKTVDQSIILRNENLELIGKLKNEKKNAENLRNEAEAANIAKTKFLASASHDLRQPLHAMGLFIDVLTNCKDEEKRIEIVSKIKKSGAALEDLLEALLDVSKLDAGVITANINSFNLQNVFDTVIPEFVSIAVDKNLSIKFVHTNSVVKSDARLVERILRNLISNAIRYTSEGKILVGCRHKKESIIVCVYDTGSGISEDKHEIIFSEFQQLENSERDRSKGLGLGLAIVKRLAILLNTSVGIKSISNKGTLFYFELPLSNEDIQHTEQKHNLTVNVNFENKHIVIIDDEKDIREGLSSLLESWGCRVTSLATIEDIKRNLSNKTDSPALILADYRLRGNETGVNAIFEIQSIFKNNAIPAVIITGDTAPERIKEAKASGHVLLHKPISGGKLRAVLNSILL